MSVSSHPARRPATAADEDELDQGEFGDGYEDEGPEFSDAGGSIRALCRAARRFLAR